MTFQCEVTSEDGVTWLAMQGRLDSGTAGKLEQKVLPIFSQSAERVVMDMAELSYISSAGLRIVLMAAKRAKKSDSMLILCNLSKEVRNIFEVSGFLKILNVEKDRAEALRVLVS